jgi:hypothetical protein
MKSYKRYNGYGWCEDCEYFRRKERGLPCGMCNWIDAGAFDNWRPRRPLKRGTRRAAGRCTAPNAGR